MPQEIFSEVIMSTQSLALNQEMLDTLLPVERSDAFFEALYGDIEEGAYTIKLCARSVEEKRANLAFELHQRPGKCLVCSLTYGLPQVFQRHPLINAANIAKEVATTLGWDANEISFELGRTEEHGQELHAIPFVITRP